MRSNVAEVSVNHMQTSEARADQSCGSKLALPASVSAASAQDRQVFRKQVVVLDKQRVQDMALRAMRACSCVSPDTASNIGGA